MDKLLKFSRKGSRLFTCLHGIALIILFNLIMPDCAGQIAFTVSQPRLDLMNDSLVIAYDISGAGPDDRYTIWLEITDSSGTEICAYSLKGDIGDSIRAGVNKQIVWNLSADSILINSMINIEIIAEKIVMPETVAKEKELSELSPGINQKEDGADRKNSFEVPAETDVNYAEVKVGKYLLQSVIFPGWGLTRLTEGKPYWIMGIAGVGCIATSVYYNRKAHDSYGNYLESSEDDITGYYDEAISRDNISIAFACAAAAIWLADLGIVGIKAISLNKSYKKGRSAAYSIHPYFDAVTETPGLSFTFYF